MHCQIVERLYQQGKCGEHKGHGTQGEFLESPFPPVDNPIGNEEQEEKHHAHGMEVPGDSHEQQCQGIPFVENEGKGEDVEHDCPLTPMMKIININRRGAKCPII